MGVPLRVLFIEDSEDDTALLVRELKRLGRRVTLIRRRKARAKKWAKGIDLRDEHTKAGVTKCHVATRWATSFTTESSECTEAEF